MAGFYITSQDKVDFIKSIMRAKINSTGKYDSPACQDLSAQVGISAATLLKASQGVFTKRTIKQMLMAGWFSTDQYRAAKTVTSTSSEVVQTAQTNNDQAEKQAVIKAAFQRGFEQGRVVGISAGKSQGFSEGYNAGRASVKPSSPPSVPSGMPIEKMRALLSKTTDRGASPAEMESSRMIVGKMVAKWMKETFNLDLAVDVK